MFIRTACSIFVIVLLLTVSAVAQQTKRETGISLYGAGRFAEAVSQLTEATAADSADYQAWLYLAAAYKNLGKDKPAIKAFERALSIKKPNPLIFDTPARITSKLTPGIRGSDTTPTSDYAVAIELRSDGTVGVVIPYMKSFFERERAIIETAKKTKFEPAVQNGKPVTVIYVTNYTFSFSSN